MLRPAIHCLIAALGWPLLITAADAPTVIEQDQQELVRFAPELAAVQPDAAPNRLQETLHATGEALTNMLDGFVDVSAAEDVHQMRLQTGGLAEEDRHAAYRYAIRLRSEDQMAPLIESRTPHPAPNESQEEKPGLLTADAEWFLNLLLPGNQRQSRFRYLGHETIAGRDTRVLAFAEQPGIAKLCARFAPGAEGLVTFQGFIWIDAGTGRVIRIRSGLLGRGASVPLDRMITDVRFAEVRFPAVEEALWLPVRVTVDARAGSEQFYNVHRYSAYHVLDVEQDKDAGGKDRYAGVTSDTGASAPDAREQEIHAIGLFGDGKPAEAIAGLREAMALDPDVPDGHYYLGLVMWKSNDDAGAESELRTAASRDPDSASAQDLLGVVLMKRGDANEAIPCFREAARLRPKDAGVQFNLGAALQKIGDRAGALAAYSAAATLAPDRKDFQQAYDALSHSVPPEEAAETAIVSKEEAPIRVNVRQVLVPVVVTGKDGHYVTGLHESDFRIFENGVEQKIAAFRVETSGAPGATAGHPTEAAAGSVATPPAKNVAPRHTYLICIDSLHADFGNFERVRQALLKLFGQEQRGDARYALITLGVTMDIAANLTNDPAAILKALGTSKFRGSVLASQKGVGGMQMADFRRELNRAREECATGEPDCRMLKLSCRSSARMIATQERSYMTWFLGQFRDLVAQLGPAPDRRTVILISDGFNLVPGQEAIRMLFTYFPEFESEELSSMGDRMQDAFEPIIRNAVRNNVVIYTIDARGLYTSGFYDASNEGGMPGVQRAMDESAQEAGDALAEMAKDTGGTFFHNNNDVFGGLRRAFADGREYYMLAYTPTDATENGKFRTITVQVSDRKAVVHAKKGYWATAN